MSKNSALAKLTATYTDSENEDKDDSSPNSENSNASIVVGNPKIFYTNTNNISNDSFQVIKNTTPLNTPPHPQKKKKRKHKVRRLVSYQDDTIVSENETVSSAESSSSSEIEDEINLEHHDVLTADSSNEKKDSETKILEKYSHYKFSLPPKPSEKPTASLLEKITNLYEKMETKNMDMNKLIQERKEFRNPSIYEKLIEFCEIDEFGTNYPSNVYDPKKWRKTEMNSYLKLAEAQKEEMMKKQKDRKTAVEVLKISSAAVDEIPK